MNQGPLTEGRARRRRAAAEIVAALVLFAFVAACVGFAALVLYDLFAAR